MSHLASTLRINPGQRARDQQEPKMNQTPLALEPRPFSVGSTLVDRVGFDIGWDCALHGPAPPAELLPEGTPLGQG